jgi:formylmethanofuran--tetrahydromethanopterin N-formyltransferase
LSLFRLVKEELEANLVKRVGQAIMTSPTSACYDGELSEFPAGSDKLGKLNIGGKLRFFGDGFQASKLVGGKRYWRIPVMEGEFLVAEEFTVVKLWAEGISSSFLKAWSPRCRQPMRLSSC